MWYKGMLKFFLISIMSFGTIVFGTISVYAAEPTPDVSIQLCETPQVGDAEIAATVLIKFSEMDLYNDNIYLSYHIYDAGGDAIINENQRVKIDLDNQGTQRLELTINYSEAKAITKDDRLVVIFDIVDEKNAFWFSDKDSIVFSSAKIDTHRTVAEKLLAEIGESKVIFGINITVSVICIIAVIFQYRKYKRNI